MDPLAQARHWLTDWGELWNVPILADHVRIVPSPRVRRSLGRCQPGSGQVRLHPALLEEPGELLREVVCHEAAHVAVHELHGRRVRPHGKEWGQLMRLAGFTPRARLDVRVLPDAMKRAVRPEVVYDHRCAVCGVNRIAGRPVRRWRCRTCVEAGRDGRLEIVTRSFEDVAS